MALIKMIVNTTKSAASYAKKKMDEKQEKRIEEEQRFISQFPYRFRYTVRQKESESGRMIIGDSLRNSYIAYNANEKAEYFALGTSWLGEHHFVVTDCEKRKVAQIEKALFNVSLPFRSERKTCDIDVVGHSGCQIETYYNINGFKSWSITYKECSIEIARKQKRKEWRVFKPGSKPIIHIYKARSDEGAWGINFRDRYFVGFDDPKLKVMALCMAIGIDVLDA